MEAGQVQHRLPPGPECQPLDADQFGPVQKNKLYDLPSDVVNAPDDVLTGLGFDDGGKDRLLAFMSRWPNHHNASAGQGWVDSHNAAKGFRRAAAGHFFPHSRPWASGEKIETSRYSSPAM